MEPRLDSNFKSAAPVREKPTRLRQELPDFYERPRRKLPMMVTAGFGFVLAATAFYSAEMIMPAAYKPSRFIGTYEAAIAEAQAEGRAKGELATRIKYDGKLKMLETQAVALQETCKAELQRSLGFYQAAYNRANVGFQIAGDIQKQYLAARISTTQQTTGGEIGIINFLTTLGYVGTLFDPEFGRATLEAADSIRHSAQAKIDEAARNGQTIDVSAWSTGLPDPATLQPLQSCALPAALTPTAMEG